MRRRPAGRTAAVPWSRSKINLGQRLLGRRHPATQAAPAWLHLLDGATPADARDRLPAGPVAAPADHPRRLDQHRQRRYDRVSQGGRRLPVPRPLLACAPPQLVHLDDHARVGCRHAASLLAFATGGIAILIGITTQVQDSASTPRITAGTVGPSSRISTRSASMAESASSRKRELSAICISPPSRPSSTSVSASPTPGAS